MTDAPPTPALDLVTEALREFGIKCASELNVTGTVLCFADEKAEPAARALLQKLAALTPPDAIRAEPVAAIPDILFDGHRVWMEAGNVKSADVSRVMDAIVRLMRKDAAPPPPAGESP